MAGAVTAAKRKATQAKASEPALLEKITVISRENKSSTVSLLGGTVRVLYWESILGDTVSASVVFSDAGNTMTKNKQTKRGTRKSKKKVSAVEGLPIIGGENVRLKFTDNNGNTINFGTDDNNLKINSIKPIPTSSQTSGKAYELMLASPEYVISNEEERVKYCSAEKISDQVKAIFEKVLKTKKNLDIEDTKNSINHTGKNKKAFFTLNTLATKSVSAKDQELGISAGYIFWETANGYHFKSIDTILSGKQKKSIIYNESADNRIPKGYDIKALTLDVDNRVNVQQKSQRGAYINQSVSIDPFTTEYKVTTYNAFENEDKLKLGGENLPKPIDAFKSKPSRTTYYFTTTGQQHIGTAEEQIEKSKDENFSKSDVVNQAIMRYNQLFASQITITIPGEFSLHAGDTIYMDIPEISESENKACGDDVNKMDGGLYIIADLCHYITAKETYTKLNLIRDSFGRTGSPTKGKTFN